MEIYEIIRPYIYKGKKSFNDLTVNEKRDLVFNHITSEDNSRAYDLLIQTHGKTLFDLWGLARKRLLSHEQAFNQALDDIANRNEKYYENSFQQEVREILLECQINGIRIPESDFQIERKLDLKERAADFNSAIYR